MKKRSGLYPRVQIDAAGPGVVSQAGAVLLVETAPATALDQELSRALGSRPWTAGDGRGPDTTRARSPTGRLH